MKPVGPASKDIYSAPVSSGWPGAEPQYVVANDLSASVPLADSLDNTASEDACAPIKQLAIDRRGVTTYSGGSVWSVQLLLHARMSPLRTLLR